MKLSQHDPSIDQRMTLGRRTLSRGVARGRLGAFALAAWTGGCAHIPAIRAQHITSRTAVHVQNRWLSLRLSHPPSVAAAQPLILFVTGDGGWHGKDLDAFDHLITWGYPVVGMSAPDYLDHLGDGALQLPAERLARDLAEIVDTGRSQLGLSATTPVLLLGVSRGADLVVVAAAQRSLRSSVIGVLAVGLTKEEEYVRRPRRRRRPASNLDQPSGNVEVGLLAHPYAALQRVTAPVCVIQSTNDEYVTAADARRLFGPDSRSRRLQAIEARNHSFSDARDALYEAVKQSLLWVASHNASPGQVRP